MLLQPIEVWTQDLWRCPVVSGIKTLAAYPFKSCNLRGGASMDRTCSSTSYRCLIGLSSGEFGGKVNTLKSLLCSSNRFWTFFFSVTGLIILLKEATVGNSIATKQCIWSVTVFRFMVRVKVTSTWIPGPCNMISLLHLAVVLMSWLIVYKGIHCWCEHCWLTLMDLEIWSGGLKHMPYICSFGQKHPDLSMLGWGMCGWVMDK